MALAGVVAVIVAVSASLLGVRLTRARPGAPSAGAYRPVRSAPASTPTTAPNPTDAEHELATMPAGSRAVAYAKVPSVTAYTTPAGAPVSTLTNPNSLGAPLVFLVQSAQGNWLDVLLPQRPNGSSGWIRASQVKLYSDDFYLVVHLAGHTLELYQAGRLVQTHPVAVGDSSSPTPTGDYYVTELVASGNPNGAYGPYAFGLSAFSDTYSEFDGGPGQIAIHGTDQPWVIGTSASHGCVRLENSQLVQLVKVLPVGTPVSITT